MPPSIPNDIYQYSLLSAYTAGLRDGGPPVAFLTNHGTHGIGYFELDEDDPPETRPNDMIQIDSVAYCIDPSGAVTKADKEDCMPHTAVTVFKVEQRVRPPAGTSGAKVKEVLWKDGKNTPLSFRVTGKFKYLSTQQATLWDVSGTIFGFCFPSWQKGISGEGLQCCFLSEDKRVGGRVDEFETGGGCGLEWGRCGRFHLGFPQDEEYDTLRI